MVCINCHVSLSLLVCGALLVTASEPDADLGDVDLPDVDAVMTEASETVSSLARASEKMEEAISSTQLQHQAHLDKLRADYTLRLAEKDKANDHIAAQSAGVKRETESLDVGNKHTRMDAKAMLYRNKRLRSVFATLLPKLRVAKVFLRAAVSASKARLHSKESQLLKHSSHPPSLENFLEDLRADGGEGPHHSLLQVSGRTSIRRAGASSTMQSRTHYTPDDTTEDIVSELSRQILKIRQEQEEATLHLKADFYADVDQLSQQTLRIKQEQEEATLQLMQNFLEDVRTDGGEDPHHSLLQVNGSTFIRRAGASSTMQSRTHVTPEDTTEDIVKELSHQILRIREAQEEGTVHLMENLLEYLRADGGEDPHHSLLQVSGRTSIRGAGASSTMQSRTHYTPELTAEDMVKKLSQQMLKIRQAQEEATLHLEADFYADLEARQLKNDQFLAEQKKLNKTRTNALHEQRDLFGAQEALGRVNEDLLNRMKGISAFALGSKEYVLFRLAMASNATRDIDADKQKEALDSAANATSRSGDLAWF